MRIWTIILYSIIIIYQNHVYYTAPVGNSGSATKGELKTKFGKIADQIINPKWALIDPDSKKKKNDSDPSKNTVNENDEDQTQPNTQNNDSKGRPKKSNKRSRKKSNNKRKSNKTNQNNIRRNGRHRWYKMVTVDYLLGDLPEYRNHEDEQNIVLIWRDGDEQKNELNEHVDALSMKNSNNYQLIRKKRDYNNTFQLQNKLQTKNVKPEDLTENEKDKLNIEANANDHSQDVERQNKKLENEQNVKKKKIDKTLEKSRDPNSFDKELSLIDNFEDDENINSNSIENSNENMTFLNLKNSNKNKFQHFVRRPKHTQKLRKTSGKNYSETDSSPLKTVKQKPNSLNNKLTISKYEPKFTPKRIAETPTNIPQLNEIDSMMDELDSQNDELYSSSLETKLEISNYGNINDNKDSDILNNKRHPVKSKSKKKGKQQPDENKKLQNRNKQKLSKPLASNNVNEKGSHQKNIKPNSPNTKDILIISYDEPEIKKKVNSDIAENTPDEFDNIMDAMNSNSDEKLDDQNNSSYPSSLETKQEIPNYSDIEDIKEQDILNNIKRPLKPKSKKLNKKQSDDNDKLPKTMKQKLTPTLESNNNTEIESPQKSIKPLAPNLNKIPTKSKYEPNLTTGENYVKITNTPEPDEFDNIMDAMNSNSDEKLDDQNNSSYPLSLETKQEIPNYSDIEDIKEQDILNNIKRPLKPKSKKLSKSQSDDNDKLPKTMKQKLTPTLESNNNTEIESPQKSIKPLIPNLIKIPTKSKDEPNLTTGEKYVKITNIPEPDEFDNIMDAMNSNSDEKLDDQNNSSYPSSLETKQEIPNYSDIEDIKEQDILNNIKRPLKPKSKKLSKKQSDDNDKLPKTMKQKLTPTLESNNNTEIESPQKSIKPLIPNLIKIPTKSKDEPNLTTGEKYVKITNIPEPDEFDNIMDAMNSNSDEKLDDQNNSSYPSSLETKQEIPNYSDIEDIKEQDILNNIKLPLQKNEKQNNNPKSSMPKTDNKNRQPTNIAFNPNILHDQTQPKPFESKTGKHISIDDTVKENSVNIPIPGITKPQKRISNNIPGNYKTIKPEVANSIGTLNFSDEEPDDLLAHINDNSNEKVNEEKPSDKSIVLVPTTDIIPKAEKGSFADEIFDKTGNMDIDSILHKSQQPNPFDTKTEKPLSDDGAVNGKSNFIPVLSSSKDDEGTSNNSPGNQKIIDLVDKSVSSSIEEFLKSSIDENGLLLPSINIDGTTVTPMEKNDKKLLNPEDNNTEFSIPKNPTSQNILEKNKSMEKLNPNSITIMKTPNIPEESISNKHDKPNIYDKTPHIDKPDKDIEYSDILDDYNNLGGMTMEDTALKKTKDKSPNIKTQRDNSKREKNKSIPNINNKTIKPEVGDSIGTLSFSDEEPDDLLAHINDNSNEKVNEEKPSDQSIVLVPTTDIIPKAEKGSFADEIFDKTGNMDIDSILHKSQQPNPFETKTEKPLSDDGALNGKSNFIPVLSSSKDDEGTSNNSPGNQKIIDLVDKSVSSSIEEFLKSSIDENGLLLPSINIDGTTVTPMEKNDKKLLNPEDNNTEFSIPNNPTSQNILEKNKSMEKLNPNSITIMNTPNIPEESISNKHDKPNIYGKTPHIDKPDKDIEYSDILDDYNNLGGMTMEDTALKKTKDKSPNIKTQRDNSITKKKKSIPNIDNTTIKPEVGDSIGTLSFSDEEPDDLLAHINDNSNEKVNEEKPSDQSIVLVPTTDIIPNAEKGSFADEIFDKTGNMDIDSILHKSQQPNPFETKTEKPLSDDGALNGKSNFIPVLSSSKDDEGTSNNSPGNQKIIDLVDKSVSSSIEEFLKSSIDENGLLLPSINIDGTTVTPMEKNDKKLLNPEDNNTEFSIPNNPTSQNILEKNKSMEKLNPNSITIMKTPNIPEESISNKNDKPNIYGKTPHIDKPDKDIEYSDILDDYNNLGGMTMEDTALKKTKDKSPNIKTQRDNSITKKKKSIPNTDNTTIKPEVGDNIGTLSFSDEEPDDLLAHINDNSNEKVNEEKPSDQSIVLVPTTDIIPKAEKGSFADEIFDKTGNMDIDSILHKSQQPNPFETKTEKPLSDDGALNGKSNFIPVLSSSKDDEGTSNNSPGNQKIIDLVDKSVSSSIEEFLKSSIDENGLLLPSINIDGTTVTPMEKNDKKLLNPEDNNTEFSIPNNPTSQNILEKNKSMEKLNPNSITIMNTPNIPEESISNKHDKPNIYGKTPHIDKPDKDIEYSDILDDYNNLGGMTMEDTALKKTKDKSPNIKTQRDNSITKKKKSIPNIDNTTIKPEVGDSIGTLSFSDEEPDDLLAHINDNSNEKVNEEKPSDQSIVLVPTTDIIPNAEKGSFADEIFDKTGNMDIDSILHKSQQPNPFETKTEKPLSDDGALNGKSNFIPVLSSSKDDEGTSNNSPGNQKIIDLVDKSVSSSIEEFLKSSIDENGLLLPSINIDGTTVTPMEKNDKKLLNPEDNNTEFSIPNNPTSQNILEKNKSMEKLNPNSITIMKTPNIPEESISNKNDKPNIYGKTPHIDKPDKDIEYSDILDDYNNLGGMTMEDTALKKTKDKSPNIKTQRDNSITKKKKSIPNTDNTTIKPEVGDNIGTLSFSDEEPDDLLAHINDNSNEKVNEEKPSDQSIVLVPTTDIIPKAEKGSFADEIFDKTGNMDIDSILHKSQQPNPFETKTEKPLSDDGALNGKSNFIPVLSSSKDDEGTSNNSPGNQKIIDLVDKSVSSSIEEYLKSSIDENGLLLPSINIDGTTVTPMEKNDKKLLNPEDNNTEFSIPNNPTSQNILEKNKSMEKLNPNSITIMKTPNIPEESISNKHDKPHIYGKTPHIDKPDKDIEYSDILDDYNNLGGMTMEDTALKKTKHKSPNIKTQRDNSITKKKKSIPNTDNTTIKPEVGDNIGTLSFSDEEPDDLLAHINDNSNEKVNEEKPSDQSIVLVPTTDIIPKAEKGSFADEIFDKTGNMDIDSILHKSQQPNPFETKTEKPLSDDGARNGKSNFIPVLSSSKDDEGTSNNSPGNQKIIDLVDKSVSSSIEEFLKSSIDENGLLLPSINIDGTTVTPMEKNDKKLLNPEDNNTEFSIPNNPTSQNILEKNKSMEKLNPNSITIMKTPNIPEESISNKNDKPNIYGKTPHIDKPDKDIEYSDILDDYNNLGGMTMEDTALKKTKDKSPNIKTQRDNSITKKKKSIPNTDNTTIKPEVGDNIGTLSFSDEEPDDLLAHINDNSNEKVNEEKPSDQSIVLVPTTDIIPKAEKGSFADEIFDKTGNMDIDSILHKSQQPNPFETKTEKPLSDDGAVNGKSNFIPVLSSSKDDEGTSNNSPGNQKIIDLVDKSVSSSIEEFLKSSIDENGLLLPSINIDGTTVTPMEKNDKKLLNPEDNNTEFSIPNNPTSQNILEKNKSMEKLNPNSITIMKTPNIPEESISNKHDKPNIYGKTPHIDIPDKDIEYSDILDDYNNLGGMTMEDTALKKTKDKSPNIKTQRDNSITKKKKSIPNTDNTTIKPEVGDSIGTLSFSDEEPDDLLAHINDNSNEKVNEEKPSDQSIVLVPTTDIIPKAEKGSFADEIFDKTGNMDIDSILHKSQQPNPFETKTEKPLSDDGAVNGKSNFIPVLSSSKDDEGTSNNSPGNQKIIDLVDKSVSSSIEEFLKSSIDENGLLLPSINIDGTTVTPMEKNDKKLPDSEDNNTEFTIPNNPTSQNLLEKNKSMEKLNPNSITIIKTPNIPEESISNKHDKPNIYGKTPHINKPDKDIEYSDILDDYNNLGGMTMEDTALKKTKDKSPNIKTQRDNSITKKKKSIPNTDNTTIKPEVGDNIGTLSFSDEEPDDLLAHINDNSNEKVNEEKPSDQSIVLVPTTDIIPKAEKGSFADEIFDKTGNMDIDSILHKSQQPNPFETKTEKPLSDDGAVNGKSNFIPVLSSSKDDEGTSNNSPGNQKIIDLVDKSVSSSIEEFLKSSIDENGLLLPSINIDGTTVTPMEKNDKKLPDSEDNNTEFTIPNNPTSQNLLEKNKSMEKLNPNSITIIKTPNIPEESISNKHDKPNIYGKTPHIDKPDTDIEYSDILDDYKNLGDMTMEDTALKKTNHKSPNIKTQRDKSITKKKKSIPNIDNTTIKPEVGDSIGTLSFSDEEPDDLLAHINDNSNEKFNEEKPSDKSIVLVPTTDIIPKAEKGLFSDENFDKTGNMDIDSILHKSQQPNPFETETEKPLSDDGAVNGKSNFIPVLSSSKDDEGTSNNSPGNQKIIDLVDKSVSSSIEEFLKSSIDENGLLLPSINIDGTTVTTMEKNDKILPNPEDNNTEFSIPNNPTSQNILEKNKSMEKLNPNSITIIKTPNIPEESISNKHDKPNIYGKTPHIDKPDKDIEYSDILDDYNNLGGMTMEDTALKKTKHKSPNIKTQRDNSITKKKKSIPNIDNTTIKPEVGDSIGTLNFSDEKPDDLLAHINDNTYEKVNEEKPSDKSIVLVPTTDIIPKAEKGLFADENFDKNNNIDSILYKAQQPNHFETKTEKALSDDCVVNGKSNFIPIPSISKNDEISDITKTEVKLPNRIIIQKKTANNILSSTNVHEKIFPGNSENEVNLSNSGQYGFKPISLNSKVPNPDEHILITNKDERSSVLSAIDKLNNSLLNGDEEINFNRNCETEPSVDNSKYLSDNRKKYIPVNQIKQQNNEFWRTPANMKHTKNETLKDVVKTKIYNDNPKVNIHDRFDNNHYDANHIDKLPKRINDNINIYNNPSTIVTSEDISPIMSDYNLQNEDDNPYGYMLPKFCTKYIDGGHSNNLWETVPPKKNNDFSIHKESDNYNNDINQSVDYTKNYLISSHVNNDKKIMSETVKNSYDDKGNTDIHNKMYDDFIKKMSEQLFKKIDNIDDKISKLDKLSNNSTYITQSYSLRSDDPGTKKIILMNDLPISKPKNKIEEPDSELDSKINKSVESHETMISFKSNDDNVIKESTKPNKDKHKKHKKHNKKHKKHSKHNRHKKKKIHKKNDKNDSYNDDEDDINDDVDDWHKKYKIHKKNDKKDDDNHKKNKSRKKNEMIDSDVDDDDDDDDGRVKKKSHKKNYINDDDIKVSRNKKTDNKKKKKIKDNILPHESNEVNKSCSLQMNSEDEDSVNGLKIKSKSKNSKKTYSTKRKKSSPKKKSKHMKHSKSIKYKNKEIPVDFSDEDSSSNKKNYNFEETNVKTSRNNNENNVLKEKTHKLKMRKHKKHKKPLKTSKTYKYKEIPVDNEDIISDENNVNLEETYNINITNDDNALKQKRLRHKRLKKMKNIDINIVKDTDNQVLNKDTNTRHGYQFYTFYPEYRYTNPFARLFY